MNFSLRSAFLLIMKNKNMIRYFLFFESNFLLASKCIFRCSSTFDINLFLFLFIISGVHQISRHWLQCRSHQKNDRIPLVEQIHRLENGYLQMSINHHLIIQDCCPALIQRIQIIIHQQRIARIHFLDQNFFNTSKKILLEKIISFKDHGG